ncbi:MAG TPA: protein phosphatase 2C domain-containing protein [Pilimelia sp.]|nr:protein phosphatase 2C domain-containing protein [Pilimelia sp.]
MNLILRAACVSDLGLVRENNEDTAYAGTRLLAVADGVGGAPAGELASDIAIRTLSALEAEGESTDPLAALDAALDSANLLIRQAAEADRGHEGLGTTLTAALLSGDRLALLHVGDSRGYMLRDGRLEQLTKDETYVQALVDQGVLTPEQARTHPHRSLVTQAVQGKALTPARATLTVAPGDRLLLCSDGLSDVVTDGVIAQAMQAYAAPQECAGQLVKLALQGGARDNVTAVVADVVAE